MIYVDAAVWEFKGALWCHLAADTLDELHEGAKALGLRRQWFQSPTKASWPHYDLSPKRRSKAVEMGARQIGRHETIYRAAVLRVEWYTARRDDYSPEVLEAMIGQHDNALDRWLAHLTS